MKVGTTVESVEFDWLKSLLIPIPPLSEQKKIAEVLSSVDESIRATQAVIDQSKVLKQGMLNQLLTKGIGHKKFKTTEIGEIPIEWEVVRIGDVVKKISEWVDVDPKETYQELGIRSHCKGLFYKEPIQGLALGNKRVFWVEADCLIVNIVFAWEQAIAYTTKNEKGLIVSHRFPMFMPQKNRIRLDFLWRLFHVTYGHSILQEASPGGAGRNRTLNQEVFLDSLIPLPPIDEQKNITKCFSAIDESINQNMDHLNNLKIVKSGLMEELLMGKKRVKQDG